jgi:hypothetical protein
MFSMDLTTPACGSLAVVALCGDLLVAAPQQQVLRALTITRRPDVFGVHACTAGHAEPRLPPAPANSRPPRLHPGGVIPAGTSAGPARPMRDRAAHDHGNAERKGERVRGC